MSTLVLKDAEGRNAAWANSVWVLMDMERQRPVKVPPELTERYGLSPRLEMEYAPRKIAEPEDGEQMTPFRVLRSHLDTNHHVNNNQYIEMARAYLPADFRTRETRVEYKAQAHLDELVCPVVRFGQDGVTVALRNEAGKSDAVIQFIGAPQ